MRCKMSAQAACAQKSAKRVERSMDISDRRRSGGVWQGIGIAEADRGYAEGRRCKIIASW